MLFELRLARMIAAARLPICLAVIVRGIGGVFTRGLLPGQEASLVETLTKVVASCDGASANLKGGGAVAK